MFSDSNNDTLINKASIIKKLQFYFTLITTTAQPTFLYLLKKIKNVFFSVRYYICYVYSYYLNTLV